MLIFSFMIIIHSKIIIVVVLFIIIINVALISQLQVAGIIGHEAPHASAFNSFD